MSEEQPLSQAEIIQLLQQSIKQLNGIVNRLSLESPETLPPQATVQTLLATTEALAASLPATPATQKTPEKSQPDTKKKESPLPMPPLEVSAELITDEEVAATSWIDRHLPSFSSLQTWWDSVLETIRSLLPATLGEKLSDWGLTAILAAIVVTVLLTSVLLLPQPTPEIAANTPETSEEIRETPQLEEIDTPFELTAPSEPEPIILEPPPGPQLTPEQSLIAAIQAEITDITRQYPQGLIASIEANFPVSRLTVTVGENWYSLSPKRQDKLANTILQRARTLDFRKLELINAQGSLIARNPVVGNEMVILVRTE